MTPSQHKLDGISIIRAFAAIAIMLYHIGFGHYYLTQISFESGVYLFFCISAFLILYTTERKKAAEFLKKRLIRIIPLYFILTLLTFAASKFVSGFGQDNVGFAELIKSLFFIPYSRSGLKSSLAIRPIVGPAWTLYFDIWFALIFFISMVISHKHRGLIASAFCIASYILGHILPDTLPLATLLRTGYMLSFVAGMLVYYIWNWLSSHKTTLSLVWGVLAIVLTLYFYFAPDKLLLKITLAATILLLTLIATRQKSVPKVFTYFSNMSFSFYLLHYYVILIIGKAIDFSTLNAKTILGALVVFVVTLLVSVCSYVAIEKNIFSLFKKPRNERSLKAFLKHCFK